MATKSKKTTTSRAQKTGKSAAAKKTPKRTVKNGKPKVLGIDPPIIIDGGGSVTIYSMNKLEPRVGIPKYPYVYYINVDIESMDWNGKNHKSDKSKNGKDFKLELYEAE